MQLKSNLAFGSLFLLTIFYGHNGYAQIFKVNQVINLAGGESLKIINSKGEGEGQECELKHFRNKTQVGGTFWLTSKSIAMQRKNYTAKTISAAPKKILPKKIQTKPQVAVTVKNTNAIPGKAQMLAIAKSPVLQIQPAVILQEKKTVQSEKVKKEFVSHNPFLSPQYKSNQTARKQSADSSKVN